MAEEDIISTADSDLLGFASPPVAISDDPSVLVQDDLLGFGGPPGVAEAAATATSPLGDDRLGHISSSSNYGDAPASRDDGAAASVDLLGFSESAASPPNGGGVPDFFGLGVAAAAEEAGSQQLPPPAAPPAADLLGAPPPPALDSGHAPSAATPPPTSTDPFAPQGSTLLNVEEPAPEPVSEQESEQHVDDNAASEEPTNDVGEREGEVEDSQIEGRIDAINTEATLAPSPAEKSGSATETVSEQESATVVEENGSAEASKMKVGEDDTKDEDQVDAVRTDEVLTNSIAEEPAEKSLAVSMPDPVSEHDGVPDVVGNEALESAEIAVGEDVGQVEQPQVKNQWDAASPDANSAFPSEPPTEEPVTDSRPKESIPEDSGVDVEQSTAEEESDMHDIAMEHNDTPMASESSNDGPESNEVRLSESEEHVADPGDNDDDEDGMQEIPIAELERDVVNVPQPSPEIDERDKESEIAAKDQAPMVAQTPSPVVDAAPSWVTAANPTSPVPPSVTFVPLQALDRDASATLVELPPIDPAALSSAVRETVTEPDYATQELIIDLQTSIQEHLAEREAAESRARMAEQRVKELESVLQANKKLEAELAETQSALNSAASDREHLLVELDKLREARDEHERKQIVLSNRLNAAKKKEAAKANLAETLEEDKKVLKHDLETTKEQLKEVTAEKAKVVDELSTVKEEYEQRLKKVEHSLSEERRLNDERKKKMKSFVENKQEEIRESKSQNDELNMELSQTNRSLREHHTRWKQLHAQWVQSQTRNRELQREINRMKKESEDMSRMGDQMKGKLSQSAQATEEHKNKRLTAKSELMTVLATLEAEREVSNKLRDSIKFTFTPKALSQQQILKESLRDFEHELLRLSQRLGRPLPPSHDVPAEMFALEDDNDDSDGAGGGRRTRSEIDSTHLLSNLEEETQRVSQCIMALASNIERMHVIIAQGGERTCGTLLSDLFAGTAAPPPAASEESASMAPRRIGLGAAARSYGQVPTANT